MVGNVFDAAGVYCYKPPKWCHAKRITLEEGAPVRVGDLTLAFYKTIDGLPDDIANGDNVMDLSDVDFADKKVAMDNVGLHTAHGSALHVK